MAVAVGGWCLVVAGTAGVAVSPNESNTHADVNRIVIPCSAGESEEAEPAGNDRDEAGSDLEEAAPALAGVILVDAVATAEVAEMEVSAFAALNAARVGVEQ